MLLGIKIEPRSAWTKHENDYDTYELRCYAGQMQLLECTPVRVFVLL